MEANLIGADLSEAFLTGADFSGAILGLARGVEQSQLDLACGDEDTGLPEGLTIPLCSKVNWYENLHGDR
ncbi:MAG: pentapeptide repeat-containing protein [Geminicoccaceae bacterium]